MSLVLRQDCGSPGSRGPTGGGGGICQDRRSAFAHGSTPTGADNFLLPQEAHCRSQTGATQEFVRFQHCSVVHLLFLTVVALQGISLVLALGTGMVQRFDVQSSPGAPPVLHQAKGAPL